MLFVNGINYFVVIGLQIIFNFKWYEANAHPLLLQFAQFLKYMVAVLVINKGFYFFNNGFFCYLIFFFTGIFFFIEMVLFVKESIASLSESAPNNIIHLFRYRADIAPLFLES